MWGEIYMIEIKEMNLHGNHKLPDYVNKPLFTNAGKVVLGLIATTAATASYTMNPTDTHGFFLTGALGLTLSAMVLAANTEEKEDIKTK